MKSRLRALMLPALGLFFRLPSPVFAERTVIRYSCRLE
jgi:hypothetical protein